MTKEKPLSPLKALFEKKQHGQAISDDDKDNAQKHCISAFSNARKNNKKQRLSLLFNHIYNTSKEEPEHINQMQAKNHTVYYLDAKNKDKEPECKALNDKLYTTRDVINLARDNPGKFFGTYNAHGKKMVEIYFKAPSLERRDENREVEQEIAKDINLPVFYSSARDHVSIFEIKIN